MGLGSEGAPALDRRRFLQAAAGGAAAAGLAGPLTWPSSGEATGFGRHRRTPVPPTPIPGGLDIPGVGVLHVLVPGDPSITLPFTLGTLQGLDVEPSTLTDFRGFAALSYNVGTAVGSDGATYDLEADLRAYKGEYVDSTGTRRFGTFAFI